MHTSSSGKQNKSPEETNEMQGVAKGVRPCGVMKEACMCVVVANGPLCASVHFCV